MPQVCYILLPSDLLYTSAIVRYDSFVLALKKFPRHRMHTYFALKNGGFVILMM